MAAGFSLHMYHLMTLSFGLLQRQIVPAPLCCCPVNTDRVTFKEWIRAKYSDDELMYIGHCGCVSSSPGLIHLSDTCALYDTYSDEIWEHLGDMTAGEPHELAFIASFDRAVGVYDDATFKNLLVWWYVEEMAREILNG
jgi:hypothetical protein